jgi:hypothetical protein
MGFAAKEAIAVLRKHHIQIAPLLQRVGLSEHHPAFAENDGNPTSHRISAIAEVKFLDYAAEAMNDSAFASLSRPTRATQESISTSRLRRTTSTRHRRFKRVTSGSLTKPCVRN